MTSKGNLGKIDVNKYMVGNTLTRYHSSFLCIDTETEGLNLAFHRPWQVAWCTADLKSIHTIKSRYIWWPDLEVSRTAAIKTRFDPVVYKANARPAREVWDELASDLYNPSYKIVWQNGLGLDVYAINNWARGCGLPPLDYSLLCRSIDTNAILKAQIKGWTPDISSPEAFLAWQYKALDYVEKGLKTNLTQIGQARKVVHDYDKTHDAENDIQLMWKIFKEVVYQVEF